MKKWIMSLLIFLLAAHAIKIVGNGGDVYVLEFVGIADQVHRYLAANETGIVAPDVFGAAVERTNLVSTDE